MKARIKEKREIAKGTLPATFDLLGEAVDFTPGQYFFVTLPDVGHRRQGPPEAHQGPHFSERQGRTRLCHEDERQRLQEIPRELPVGTEVEAPLLQRLRNTGPFSSSPRRRPLARAIRGYAASSTSYRASGRWRAQARTTNSISTRS
jgi:hypothetical protein